MVHHRLPLSEIFDNVFQNYGEAKSLVSLRHKLASLVDNPDTEPLAVLYSIGDLLKTSPESMVQLEEQCLFVAMRFIQRIARETVAMSVNSVLANSPKKTF